MTPQQVTYRRPWIADYQRDGIFHEDRYGLIEASTKSGKTVGCMIWLTEQALQGRPGWNYWWVAPILDQSRIVYRRLKRALPRALYADNKSELTLTLPNGCVLWFKGADHPDSLYGEDVHAAVIDEATRCKEDAWHAVRTTLTATGGPIRIIGNVKGRKNWAYHLARKAEAGEPGMHYAKITAFDAVQAGLIPASEVDDAQRQLPASVFRELYLAEPSDDGGNPFGLAAIAKCVRELADSEPVAWGWDLAKSVDYTVGIALDVEGRTCRLERFQRPWEDTLRTIRAVTGAVPALVDSTGVGDPIVERLQKDQADQPSAFRGFKFSSVSKQQLMEGLAVAIQQQAISYPDGPIKQELDAFEYVYTRLGVKYSAPEGLHDDCVVALALATQQWRAMQGWTLSIWGGDLGEPQTEAEKEEAEQAKVLAAQQAVLDGIARDGIYWPNGGRP